MILYLYAIWELKVGVVEPWIPVFVTALTIKCSSVKLEWHLHYIAKAKRGLYLLRTPGVPPKTATP